MSTGPSSESHRIGGDPERPGLVGPSDVTQVQSNDGRISENYLGPQP